ncbi:MAG: bacterial/archaeal transporter family-2 protein [Clostridiales bacterium]|nr:bacterial/archaeal transporter family-2 protein [Clostridiales bacterium]
MPKFLAFFTGLALSVMVYYNGQLSGYTSAYFSNLIYHTTGLIFFAIVLRTTQRSDTTLPFKPIYLLPGFMGSLTVILNNVIVAEIGITLMVALTLLGQVLTSLTIDHFGLFGKPKLVAGKRQWIGTAVIVAGLIIMLI